MVKWLSIPILVWGPTCTPRARGWGSWPGCAVCRALGETLIDRSDCDALEARAAGCDETRWEPRPRASRTSAPKSPPVSPDRSESSVLSRTPSVPVHPARCRNTTATPTQASTHTDRAFQITAGLNALYCQEGIAGKYNKVKPWRALKASYRNNSSYCIKLLTRPSRECAPDTWLQILGGLLDTEKWSCSAWASVKKFTLWFFSGNVFLLDIYEIES